MVFFIRSRNPRALRDELHKKFLPHAAEGEIEQSILGCLPDLRRGALLTKQALAKHLAGLLYQRWAFVTKSDMSHVEVLINYRPTELAAVLNACDSDVTEFILKHNKNRSPIHRKRRSARNKEGKDRQKGLSKERYERLRRNRVFANIGMIEDQFGLPVDKLHPPYCLDLPLKGGLVAMSIGAFSLQSLFGKDRHQLPKNLPTIKRGRRVMYDLHAVLQCMVGLLKAGKWPTDHECRKLLVAQVIGHANEISGPEFAKLVEDRLTPYLR